MKFQNMDNKNGITNGLKGKTISTVELLAMTNGKSSKIYTNSHVLLFRLFVLLSSINKTL